MVTIDYQLLGRQIRATRRAMRMTQSQLASLAGVSTSFMGHLERGTRVPSLDTLASLAGSLDASIEDLLRGAVTYEPDVVQTAPEQPQRVKSMLKEMINMQNDLLDDWKVREDENK